jgi:acyl transferase domain-containing protein
LPVALLLPGHGCQYPGMAVGLYGREPIFTAAIDEVFTLLGADGSAARAEWLAATPVTTPAQAARSQMLLFAVEYALGRLVFSWNVRPAAMLGHSMGEFVSATLAGVFALDDATRLVRGRANYWTTLAPGGMVAVAASAADVRPYLSGDVAVGAINAPRQTIISGPTRQLDAVVRALVADGHTVRPIPATAAFHSPALRPAVPQTLPLFAGVRMRPPRLRLYSAYTGSLTRPEEAVDPVFWASQPAAPVLFWPALEAMLNDRAMLLCEVGPGSTLSTVARQHPSVRADRSAVVSLLPSGSGALDELASIKAAAQVVSGYAVG